MTLLDWRKNSERLSLAHEVLNHPAMVQMMAVMDAEHPAKQQRAVADGFGATRVLGQIEGFQEALNMLRSFAQPLPEEPEDVPTTWNVGLPDDDDQKPR